MMALVFYSNHVLLNWLTMLQFVCLHNLASHDQVAHSRASLLSQVQFEQLCVTVSLTNLLNFMCIPLLLPNACAYCTS